MDIVMWSCCSWLSFIDCAARKRRTKKTSEHTALEQHRSLCVPLGRQCRAKMFYLFIWCWWCFYHPDVLTVDAFFWRAWARCCLKKNIMFPLRCNCVFHFVALIVKKTQRNFTLYKRENEKFLNDIVPLSCRPNKKKKLLSGESLELLQKNLCNCIYTKNMDSVFECIWNRINVMSAKLYKITPLFSCNDG